jgi:phosphatidate cytidylyltransferase
VGIDTRNDFMQDDDAPDAPGSDDAAEASDGAERHEGVRILGAGEAAELAEREDVVARRGRDDKGFGDRPDSPTPRPDLPTVRISTSDVPVASDAGDGEPARPDRFGAIPVVRIDGPPPDQLRPDHMGHARLVGDDETGASGAESTQFSQDAEEAAMPDSFDHDESSADADERLDLAGAEGTSFDQDDDAFVLPHWTEPPTGQVPKTVIADGEPEEPATGSQPRWRDERERGEAADFDDLRGDGPQLGALADQDQPREDDYFSGESDDPFLAFAPDEAEEPSSERVTRRRAKPAAKEKSLGSRLSLGRLRGAASASAGSDDAADDGSDETSGDVVVAEFAAEDVDGTEIVEFDGSDGDAARAGGGPRTPVSAGGGGAAGGDRNLATAVAVGVGLVLVGLLCFKLGGFTTALLACVVVGFAAVEYVIAVPPRGFRPATLVGLVGIIGLLLATYFAGLAAYPVVITLTVIIGMLWYLWVTPGDNSVRNLGVTLLGFLWIGFLGSFATLFLGLGRQMQNVDPALTSNPGIGVLIAAVIASVASDVGGYFVGKYMGRTQLSLASPNKTQEGLIGGFVSALVAVIVIVGFFGIAPIGGSFPRVFIFALLCALVAPLGDLCESFIKRDLGLKDMGTILPGHGGVLDRFDGLLFVLPTAYFVTLLFDVWKVG